MINRVYIDNYKCFTSFEFRPQGMQLVLGDNGSGKTSVLDVLDRLRRFVGEGLPSVDAFPIGTLTAWDKRSAQTYELELSGNGGAYQYRLVIEHDRNALKTRVQTEGLLFDGQPLYEFDGSDAHLYRDEGSAGPVFPFDSSRSAIATIPERRDNQKLTWFRRRIGQIYVFSPDPVRMTSQSEAETAYPDRRLLGLASWLRHLLQQRADFGAKLLESLQAAIEGLENLRFHRVSEAARVLQLEFDFHDAGDQAHAQRFWLNVEELSDGQRNLLALYTILSAAVHRDATVCLDEPDNFVSLREIQPWLTELRDRAAAVPAQCLVISHHPELINYLAAQHGTVFFRDESGPVRSRPFEWTGEDALTPAELVARGWK